MGIKLLFAKGMKKLLNPPALRNCSIDKTSRVCPKSELNYVTAGRYTYVGNDCFMVNVAIGSFCSVADRVCIGGASHPVERVSQSPVFHEGQNVMGVNFRSFPFEPTPKTKIGNDVWIGQSAIIKAGVKIGNGAVVGAGSVVTHDVPAYEIWAGNPARKIRDRFDRETADRLEKTAWWNWDEDRLRSGSADFDDVAAFLDGADRTGGEK